MIFLFKILHFNVLRKEDNVGYKYISQMLNPSPNDKILNVTKLKAFTDNKINVAKMMISVFDRLENIMGKEESAGYQHFLLYPPCFQKASFLG